MTDFTGALVAAGIGAAIGYGSAFLSKRLRDLRKGQESDSAGSPNPHVFAILLALLMGVSFVLVSWQ